MGESGGGALERVGSEGSGLEGGGSEEEKKPDGSPAEGSRFYRSSAGASAPGAFGILLRVSGVPWPVGSAGRRRRGRDADGVGSGAVMPAFI